MHVSVIIPIYNPGNALTRCLDSLMSQSYKDIEILLVDDGSTDGSDIVCKEFEIKDKRIKYLHQENAGVSAARNAGIDASTGEYLCFVDSDDYVEPDYVQSMVEAFEKSGADIVIQGLKQFKDELLIKTETFEDGVFYVSKLTSNQFDDIFYYCGPYCKLFKASVIKTNRIKFPVGLSYGEDAVFYHAYLANCNVIELISATFYNYTVANQGALSTKALAPDKFWQNQINRRSAYRNLKKKFGLPMVLSKKEQACKLAGISGMLSAIFKSGADDASARRYLDMMSRDEDFRLLETKLVRAYHRCTFRLIKWNNRLSRRILKTIFQ